MERDDIKLLAEIGTFFAGVAAVVALLISVCQIDLMTQFRKEDRVRQVRPFLVPTSAVFSGSDKIEIQNLGYGVALDVAVRWKINGKTTYRHATDTTHVLPNEKTKLKWMPPDIKLPDIFGTDATLIVTARDIDGREYRFSQKVDAQPGDAVEIRLSGFEILED